MTMPYTAECQEALEQARGMAVEFDGAEVRPLHLLMWVASSPIGRWAKAVASMGIEREALQAWLVKLAGEGGGSGEPESI